MASLRTIKCQAQTLDLQLCSQAEHSPSSHRGGKLAAQWPKLAPRSVSVELPRSCLTFEAFHTISEAENLSHPFMIRHA